MTTFLYIVWFLIPSFFLFMALYGKLEQLSGKSMRDDVKDYLHSFAFTLAAAITAVLIDRYLLTWFHVSFVPEWVPRALFQLLLLPLLFYISALVLGPSKDIRITKAPRASKKTSSKRRTKR